ncbi:MAG TPA: ribosome maturation factor RimM [Longimicrobiales bacterium]|jgi:16S rRNA processing protein RimM
MSTADPSHLVVGHINKAHGTRGEVFVWPLTDHPEHTFVPGVVLRMAGEGACDPDPDLPPLEIASVRPFRRGFLVGFAGVHDREGADRIRGAYLVRPLGELKELDEGEVFYHDLLGTRVETVEGLDVGTVVEVYELRPADLLEVSGPGGSVLIPLLEGVVVSLDAQAKLLVIDPPDGLLEAQS